MNLPFRTYTDILILKKANMPPQEPARLRQEWQGLQHGLVCFCLGGAGLYFCASGQVGWMLAPKFFPWLAWGSLALMVLAVYAMGRSSRALLSSSGSRSDSADPCHTRHACVDQECQLVYYAPARFALLSFPLGLVLWGMPSQGLACVSALDIHLFQTRQIESKGSVNVPSFKALMLAAQTQGGRDHFEGREVTLTGKIVGLQPDRFTMIRYRMNCCAADASPLKAAVVVAGAGAETIFPKVWEDKMVQVRGQLQFTQDKDKSWLPVLVIPTITPENPLAEWMHEVADDYTNLYENS